MKSDDFKVCMKRFKEKRLALGLSFQNLADKTGMSKATLQRYESGDMKNLPVGKIKILADVLQTTPHYLLGWPDDEIDSTIYVGMKLINKINGLKATVKDISVNGVVILETTALHLGFEKMTDKVEEITERVETSRMLFDKYISDGVWEIIE